MSKIIEFIKDYYNFKVFPEFCEEFGAPSSFRDFDYLKYKIDEQSYCIDEVNLENICSGYNIIFFKKLVLDNEISDDFKKEIIKDVDFFAEASEKEGLFYNAYSLYCLLNDKEKIDCLGVKCLNQDPPVALNCFKSTNNRKGILDLINFIKNDKERDYLLESSVAFYFLESNKVFCNNFKKWCKSKNFNFKLIFDVARCANMVYSLSKNYDFGIGVAKGGLFLSYFSDIFGLKTLVLEAHAHDIKKPKTFSWIDEIDKRELKDKKIIVFDKDFISGRTARYVANKLKKYEPKQIDLAVIHNPKRGQIFSNDCNLFSDDLALLKKYLKGYSALFYPDKFDYSDLGWIKKLEKKHYS